MENLSGQVAIVTGGIRGIGRAITEELLARGANVLASYSAAGADTDKALAELGELAAAKGCRIEGFQGDNSRLEDISRMFDACLKAFGRPDIFVGNAGVGVRRKPMLEYTEAEFDKVCNLNFKGNFFCIQKAGELLNDGGRIVIMSSATAAYPQTGQCVYTPTKAALESLVEVAALEFGERGITVNAVAPGVTKSNMSKDLLTEEFMKFIIDETPLHRMAEPVDVARIVAFFCEKRSQWVSGDTVIASGGCRH